MRPTSCALLSLLVLATAVAGTPGAGGGLAAVRRALDQDDPASAATIVRPLANQGDPHAELVLGVLTDIGAGVRIDHPAALSWVEKAAAHNPAAAAYLQWRFATGFGADKPDPTQAAHWAALVRGHPSEPAMDDWLHPQGTGLAPPFARALQWMMDHADDNGVAAANLAEAYLNTQWTSPSPNLNLYWLKHAAALHDAPSLEKLAMYSDYGLFVPKDPVAALNYRRQAAEAGSVTAQLALGNQYRTGDGVPTNAAEAAKWYRLAAAQDNATALVKLSGLLRTGAPGLRRDDAEALQLARRAAALGSPDALTAVGDMLRAGQGAPKDLAGAAHAYEQAAAKGNAYAADALGWMYQRGELGPMDRAAARHWFEKAAAGGNDNAMEELGIMYRDGKGIPKDPAHAFRWFERAARDGDGWAQNEVGWMLRQGIGIARDDEEAVGWFRLAVQNGEPLGDENLGYQYLHGRGVPKDIPKAVTHFLAAARVESDDWLRENLLAAFDAAGPSDRAAIDKLLAQVLADPKLLSVRGALPENVLELLDRGPAHYGAAARKLVAAMIASNRPQSRLTVAWHAFLGQDTAYDLARAHAAARAAAALHPRGSARVLAAIDSLAANTPQAREAARAALHHMADDGDRSAAAMLGTRFLTGDGEPRDASRARHYLEIAYGHDAKVVAKIMAAFPSPAVHPPPSSAEIAQKVATYESAHPGEKHRLPVPLYRAAPVYPYTMRVAGIQGSAYVTFIVGKDGVPANVACKPSSQPIFAAAAINAVRQWRFVPALKDGKPVAASMAVPLLFTLNPAPPSGRSLTHSP